MESAGKKGALWQEKVKDILGDLGIAGETVSPSPARTVEELANLGIIKGYSTIVAAGSEKMANKIVTAIISQKSNRETVLGIIPDNFDSMLAKRVGVKDIREACNALKFRKLETVDACQVEPHKYFLTEGVIENGRSTDVYLTLDQIKAGLPMNKIIIKPGLEIQIQDLSSRNFQGSKKFFRWLFGRKNEEEKDIYSSLFHSKKARIESPDRTITLKVDDEILAKSPIVCHNRPKALKIVVARDTINPKNENI